MTLDDADVAPVRAPIADVLVGGKSVEDVRLAPPLVSIVLVNRNYARFVGEALASIRRQTYSRFECIVIDNASTDDSVAAIEAAIAGDSRFRLLRRAENVGQLGAFLGVLDDLTGGFVVVVDADDTLFPDFLACHLQVHLAVPDAVGFSSSNIIETDADGNLLTGGRTTFAIGCEADPRGLKPAAEAPRLEAIAAADYTRLSGETIRIPYDRPGWCWAPGTANMYRMAAVRLVAPEAARVEAHAGFDNYFTCILHLLTGAALITRHLSGYRFHGRNAFGRSPPMAGVRTFHSLAARRSSTNRTVVLHTLMARAEEFNWLLSDSRLWITLDGVGATDGVARREYFARDYVQAVLVENLPTLVGTFGADRAITECAHRVGGWTAWRLARAAYGGRPPPAVIKALTKDTLWRAGQRIRRLKG